MVQVLPLSGWRFDLSQVGALSEVLAPNPRALSEDLQRTLYRQHPCNVVRLIANREEPGDTSPADRSQRADDFFRLWRKEGILVPEHDLAFYVIETTYESVEGRKSVWSVVGRLELSQATIEGATEPASPVIGCSNETQRLLELRRVTNGDFTPVVALASADLSDVEADTDLYDVLEKSVRQMTPLECLTDTGIRHRTWPVMNLGLRNQISQVFSRASLTIVDGVDQWNAANLHAEECRTSGVSTSEHDGTQTVLVRLIPADQPDLALLPDLQKSSLRLTSEQLKSVMSSAGYQCQHVGDEPYACLDALELASLNDQQPCFAVGTVDGIWYLVFGLPESAQSVPELAAQPVVWPETTESAADVLQRWANQANRDVLIVRPARSVAEVMQAAAGSLNHHQVQLIPALPAGLVLSFLGR